jgi:glucose/arabinose dehydrogenase
LSYFTRPKTTITTQNVQTAKEKKAAMDLITQKKAHL